VLGKGQTPADVLFIGEAPGKSENLMGFPFVGPSGNLLEKAITITSTWAGARPRYYITNTVACWPRDEEGNTRPPEDDEVMACAARLEDEIRAVKPKRIIFVGNVAEKHLSKRYTGKRILHPAYLLRRGRESAPEWLGWCREISDIFKEALYDGKGTVEAQSLEVRIEDGSSAERHALRRTVPLERRRDARADD